MEILKPDPHQERDAQGLLAALKKYDSAIDAGATGVGKSFTFLYLCKLCGAKPAIITRKAIVPAWVDLAKRMGIEPMFITNYEQLLSENFPYTLKKKVSGTSKVTGLPGKPVTKFVDWTLPDKRVIFCFDEAQALRSKSTFASNAALGAAKKFKTVLLSATPFQQPMEAQVIGRILKLFPSGKEFMWLLNHGCKKDHFGIMQFVGDKGTERDPELREKYRERGRQIMAQINQELFPEHGVRTRREEIPGFPESKIEFVPVETGEADAITSLYLKELELLRERDHERASADVEEEFKHMVEVLPVVVNLRIRQEIEILKARAMADMAISAHEAGEQVAVFVNFDATIEVLKKLLGTNNVIRGSGELKGDAERRNTIHLFRTNKIPYVVVNSAAGGAGLSLHDDVTKVSRTSIISPPFSAVLLKQIQGRVWRRGGGFSTQKLVFADGTAEMRVMERVRAHSDNLDTLLDGDLDVRNFL